MPIDIVTLADEPVEQEFILALLYGPPGIGKTVFAAGSQQWRTLFLDVDQGRASAKTFKGNPELNIPPTRKDLVYRVKIKSWDDMLEAVDYAEANTKFFDLVVIDTFTELQQLIATDLRQTENLDILRIPDWGVVLNRMEMLAQGLRNNNMHVLLTAHETVKFDEQEQRNMYMPRFQGSFKEVYSKHFSIVMRYVMWTDHDKATRTNTTQRWIQCQRDQYTHARDRSNSLEFYELPMLDHIFGKYLQGIKGNPSVGAEPAATAAT